MTDAHNPRIFAQRLAALGYVIPGGFSPADTVAPVATMTRGKHNRFTLQVTDGGPGAYPCAASWALSLSLGAGSLWNRWSAANFVNVEAATAYAIGITDAIEAYEAGSNLMLKPAAPASPLDELDADLRAWLVEEMGMEVEHGGGGCMYLRHEGPHGSYLLVTCEGGGGMPAPDSWQVGAYRDNESDAILDFVSDQEAVTLRMAVGAACGVLADFTAPPVQVLTRPSDATSFLVWVAKHATADECGNGNDDACEVVADFIATARRLASQEG